MSQGITSYSYDDAQRMTTITTSYGGTAGPQIVFNYDKGSRLTSTSRQIGSVSTATEVNTTIVYDNANRVTTITDGVSTYNSFPPGSSASPIATYVYSYDCADLILLSLFHLPLVPPASRSPGLGRIVGLPERSVTGPQSGFLLRLRGELRREPRTAFVRRCG